ncbi:MAG: type II/IV secretion system ATPase subunit [Candidatus Thermoplasmatota archaeon]|nr:type II/IV secretion system ATPase subunit [Candidatus Thermoplasmatota archaeon]
MPHYPDTDEVDRSHFYSAPGLRIVSSDSELETIESYSINRFDKVKILRDLKSGRMLYFVTSPGISEDETRTLGNIKKSFTKSLKDEPDILPYVDRKKYLNERVSSYILENHLSYDEDTLNYLQHIVQRDYLGYGKIDAIMNDANVEDISCDGAGIPIYVYHKKYRNLRTNLTFEDDRELNNFIVLLSQKGNKQISVSDPILDASTPEGNRINATFGKEVTAKGGTFTIRLFKKVPLTPVDLVLLKTASPELMAYLWMATESGKNLIVLGGTGVGKTSTLNAVSIFLPSNSKIVSIEDTSEINIPHKNWISAITRSGVGEGRFVTGRSAGEIDMFDLLMSALRQRPDYMIVGEIRGKEAYNLFQAMSMGQTTLTTMHAESIDNMITRLENHPLNIPRTMFTSINCVVLQSQVKINGRLERRITEVSEIVRLDPESNELTFNTIFYWDSSSDKIVFSGKSEILTEKIESNGPDQEEYKEFNSRTKLIKYLSEMKVTDYKEMWNYLRKYSKDPTGLYSEIESAVEERRKSGE